MINIILKLKPNHKKIILPQSSILSVAIDGSIGAVVLAKHSSKNIQE